MLNFLQRLLRKSSALSLTALRFIPQFPQFEYQQYCSIEKQLSLVDFDKISSSIPTLALNQYNIRESLVQNTDYRVIDLENLTENDREYIKKMGCFVEYITANKFSRVPENVNEENPGHGKDKYDKTFQLDAIKTRYIKAICPRSGTTLLSNRSLLAEPGGMIFYRFIGQEYVFYLAVGRAEIGYIKSYLYFPELQTVILLGDREWAWLGRWEIDLFRAYLISNYKNVFKYIKNQTVPTLCALLDHGHFAHHIWNTLTGLSKIATKPYANMIDKLVIANEPMGPIDQLFPEFEVTKYWRLPNSRIVEAVLKQNLFLVRPGGTIVTDDVIDRIHHVATINSSPHCITDSQEFREKHWPILWATISTNNRNWLSQAKGIASIANKFKKFYPDFALIIDGYAIPYGQSYVNKALASTIANEQQVAQKIIALLNPSIELRLLIGKPIFESVIYSQCADFYLAHHGSIQHKIAWLSKKPGVVHSNKTVLTGISGTKQYYAAFTSIESGILPVYMSPEFITDMPLAARPSGLRWHFGLGDYDFNSNHAFDELLKILPPVQ